MTQLSKTAQSKTIDFLLSSLLSIALVVGAAISVALYAGFEGFHRGELAVKQMYSADIPPPLIEVQDDYEMVKWRYSLVAGALLTALVLYLVISNRVVNWVIIVPLIVAALQFRGIFGYKNAAFAFGSDKPRFAFMLDTYSLDLAVCVAMVIATLSIFVRSYRTR
ncbi:MAG: hypothetical protein AB7J13_09195 [Pyrinomonadaceae bacterium]